MIKCRAVSTAFRDYVDTKTPLWRKKSLIEAVNDEELDQTVRLELVKKILESKGIERNMRVMQRITKAAQEGRVEEVGG